MHELRPGLWTWAAPHPEWTPDEPWRRDVRSYAVDDGTRLLFIDPQTVPTELIERSADREPVVVLTAPWHERDTRELVAALGTQVFTPAPDSAADLVRKFGITLEQAGDGSPDLRWLFTGGGVVRSFASGDRLPFGFEAFAGREANDTILWVERFAAIIVGDTLVDFGSGFGINPYLREGVTREALIERLRPILELPIELVLPTHGEPTDAATLERALRA